MRHRTSIFAILGLILVLGIFIKDVTLLLATTRHAAGAEPWLPPPGLLVAPAAEHGGPAGTPSAGAILFSPTSWQDAGHATPAGPPSCQAPQGPSTPPHFPVYARNWARMVLTRVAGLGGPDTAALPGATRAAVLALRGWREHSPEYVGLAPPVIVPPG